MCLFNDFNDLLKVNIFYVKSYFNLESCEHVEPYSVLSSYGLAGYKTIDRWKTNGINVQLTAWKMFVLFLATFSRWIWFTMVSMSKRRLTIVFWHHITVQNRTTRQGRVVQSKSLLSVLRKKTILSCCDVINFGKGKREPHFSQRDFLPPFLFLSWNLWRHNRTIWA